MNKLSELNQRLREMTVTERSWITPVHEVWLRCNAVSQDIADTNFADSFEATLADMHVRELLRDLKNDFRIISKDDLCAAFAVAFWTDPIDVAPEIETQARATATVALAMWNPPSAMIESVTTACIEAYASGGETKKTEVLKIITELEVKFTASEDGDALYPLRLLRERLGEI